VRPTEDRYLDALVAEKIMGWKRMDRKYSTLQQTRTLLVLPNATKKPYGYTYRIHTNGVWIPNQMPCYSTDISAAWTVVERMKRASVGPGFSLVWWPADGPDEAWCASFGTNNYPDRGEHVVEAVAPTAPLAICQAALKAVETVTSRAQGETTP
jgi:hypothetical protein